MQVNQVRFAIGGSEIVITRSVLSEFDVQINGHRRMIDLLAARFTGGRADRVCQMATEILSVLGGVHSRRAYVDLSNLLAMFDLGA